MDRHDAGVLELREYTRFALEALSEIGRRIGAPQHLERDIPAEQRVPLVLLEMQGYSVAEIAAMLGVAEGTVKSRCARGRARLAALLGHLRVERDPTLDAPGGNPGTTPGVGSAMSQPIVRDTRAQPAEGGAL